MYLLISYKPDSSDYCMGCHMASYEGDLSIEKYYTIGEVIEEVMKLNSTHLRCNEAGYEHQLFVLDDKYHEDEYNSDDLHEARGAVEEARKKGIEQGEKIYKAEKQKEKEEEKKRHEEQERLRYEALHKKFGNSVVYEDGLPCSCCGHPRVFREVDGKTICGTKPDCGKEMKQTDICSTCKEYQNERNH